VNEESAIGRGLGEALAWAERCDGGLRRTFYDIKNKMIGTFWYGQHRP
jgi:hypothetical protein